jgi:hypothetical protein
MPRLNGDIIPSASGIAHLGVNGGVTDGAFDITSIAPFGHVHMLSGVLHDPLLGQSGVVRFSQQAGAFEISVDGGLTFNSLLTNASVVTSIGVLGDANLTGAVDLATPASGFITIQDSTNASPLLFSVDTLGLSGLWGFPAQGFNGSVVNALTDFNGTKSQGVINILGASGIVVDIVGQTMTISADGIAANQDLAKGYAESFASSNPWVVNHNLGTADVQVFVLDASSPRLWLLPDEISITNANTVTIDFGRPQAGRVVILGIQ